MAAADSCARKRPSEVMKLTRYTEAVLARMLVIFKAKRNSFQEKMKQIKAVAEMPGIVRGNTILRKIVGNEAPSISAAAMMSLGRSARKECIIQIATGKFIAE